LGPIEVSFIGIDKKLGILVTDGSNAITCHLKQRALRQLQGYLIDDVSSLIGRKLLLNPNGKRTSEEPAKTGLLSFIKINQVQEYEPKKPKVECCVQLKVCLKRDLAPKETFDGFTHTFLAGQQSNHKETKLHQQFKFIVRLEVNDLLLVEEPSLTAAPFTVQVKPRYIEEEPEL